MSKNVLLLPIGLCVITIVFTSVGLIGYGLVALLRLHNTDLCQSSSSDAGVTIVFCSLFFGFVFCVIIACLLLVYFIPVFLTILLYIFIKSSKCKSKYAEI